MFLDFLGLLVDIAEIDAHLLLQLAHLLPLAGCFGLHWGRFDSRVALSSSVPVLFGFRLQLLHLL